VMWEPFHANEAKEAFLCFVPLAPSGPASVAPQGRWLHDEPRTLATSRGKVASRPDAVRPAGNTLSTKKGPTMYQGIGMAVCLSTVGQGLAAPEHGRLLGDLVLTAGALIAAGVFAVHVAPRGGVSVSFGSSGTLRGLLVRISIMGVMVLAPIAATWYVRGRVTDTIVLGAWCMGNVALLFCMYTFLRGRRFRHLPMAPGRILAIVAAYEENPDDLHACIWSIINQRNVVVDEVHVVDDGSVRHPVQPFAHPRVRWHRTENGGKRAAQVYVLDRIEPDDWNFVLMVGSDSVLDEHAMEHQLRAFSSPQVMMTSGTVLMRNAQQNLLTRIVDMNIGTSCVMMRASRTLLGPLEAASGPMAAYRAHIVFKHRERYPASGASDDRCLTVYSALEGEVVGVNEALVWSATPAHMPTTYRQRLHWSKSWWFLIQLAIGPLAVACAVVLISVNAYQGTLQWPSTLLYPALYLLVRYAGTGLYLVERPGLSRRAKFWTWLLLTPAETVYQLLFLNPAKYVALLKLRGHGWGSRSDAHSTELSQTPRDVHGSIYYSGYPVEGPQS
jgi:cellulose synthase/poly-beta-1,6-N-acetylglucosamine synthase-like glycosyltransferase